MLEKVRSVEELKEYSIGTKWWKDAGIVQKRTIPTWCRNLPGSSGAMRHSMSAEEMHYHLSCVALHDAQALHRDLEAYYASDNAHAAPWLHYHMSWKLLNDVEEFVREKADGEEEEKEEDEEEEEKDEEENEMEVEEEEGGGGGERKKEHRARMERFLAMYPGPPSQYEVEFGECDAEPTNIRLITSM